MNKSKKLQKNYLIKIYDNSAGNIYEKTYFEYYQCNYPPDLLRLFVINSVLPRFEEFSVVADIIRKINDMKDKTRLVREFVTTVIREYNILMC